MSTQANQTAVHRRSLVFIFLIMSFFLLFYSLAKGEEFGPHELVSHDRWDMSVNGNCLPFELENISFNCTIPLTTSAVTSLNFLSPTEIVAFSETGQVFYCDIETQESRVIAKLWETDSLFGLKAHNHENILVTGPIYYDELTGDALRDIVCLNRNGIILWSLKGTNFQMPVVYDGNQYLLVSRGQHGNAELYSLSITGDVELIRQYDTRLSSLYWIFPTANELVWAGGCGPYVSQKDDGYSSMEHIFKQWNLTLSQLIIDSEDRIIGYTEFPCEREIVSHLIILDREQDEPIAIPIANTWEIESWKFGCGWYENERHSSNGLDIVFTYTHYLLKYSNGDIDIILDNLDDYVDGNEDVLLIRYLFMDEGFDDFLIILKRSILYGSDDINVVEINAEISSDLIFSENYERACLGTEDGSVIVLDIVQEE